MTTLLRTIVCGVVLGMLMSSATPAAQTARRRPQRADSMTASIVGRVTTAGTGAPVRGSEVRLSSSGGYRRMVTTDGDGRFDLSDLPAGEYRLDVSRAGFSSLQFGQRRPLEAPTTIDLAEGEAVTANVALPKGGVIHGRVFDQFGEPVAGTRVQALRSRVVQGQRRLQSVGPGDQTDDTGAFRVYGLPPGDYYVAASPGPAGTVRRDPPIYYPGTPSFAEAQPITLPVGAEMTADVQIVPVRNARVSGIVLNSAGAPVAAMVSLVSDVVGVGPTLDATTAPSALRMQADSAADGTFTIDNVPPGPYTATATLAFRPVIAGSFTSGSVADGVRQMEDMLARVPESVSAPIAVAGDDVSGLTLVTRTPGILTVSIVPETGVARRLPTGIRVDAASTNAGSMSMFAGGRDSFRLAGMTGPFHLRTEGIPEGWAVSAIMMDGVDVTDEPIELKGQNARAQIVLTDRVTSVNGVVQSQDADARHSVVVFADDDAKWTYPSRYIRVTRADDQGRFQVSGLPPNERYLAVAVDYLEAGEEQDPRFLDGLSRRATSFALREGEQRSMMLEGLTR